MKIELDGIEGKASKGDLIQSKTGAVGLVLGDGVAMLNYDNGEDWMELSDGGTFGNLDDCNYTILARAGAWKIVKA